MEGILDYFCMEGRIIISEGHTLPLSCKINYFGRQINESQAIIMQ
jgi:hypothetical protein